VNREFWIVFGVGKGANEIKKLKSPLVSIKVVAYASLRCCLMSSRVSVYC